MAGMHMFFLGFLASVWSAGAGNQFTIPAAGLILINWLICRRHDSRDDAREVIAGLLDGMQVWAADEDGIHSDAWDAYQRGCVAIGRPVAAHEE